MTGRLIVFFLFLITAFSLMSISGYKKYFSAEHSLNLEQIRAGRAKAKAAEEALLAAKNAVPDTSGVVVLSPEAIKGKEIYTSEVAQCLRCHGEDGRGNASEEAPLIAGQYDWYVLDQLTQMKAGTRTNDKMMPFLETLGESEFKALAAYINTLRIKE